MPEVSSRSRVHSTPGSSQRSQPANRRIYARQIDARIVFRATTGSSSEYQNPIRNPYGLLPRPPQTQAAHFKRLYRK
jgi:hypothetical protein